MVIRHIWRVGGILLLGVLAAGLLFARAVPAQAHAQDVGYSIALSADGATTIAYGTGTSAFHATFDHPTTKPANANEVTLYVDNGINAAGTHSITATEDVYFFNTISGLAVGTHQVQARYFLSTTNTWITSNTLTITVNKGDVTLGCGIGGGTLYNMGQSLTLPFALTPTQGTPLVDWQGSTFTLSFIGPTTVNYPNLTLDASMQATVNAPSTAGRYSVNCTFSGSPSFNPATSQQQGIVITQGHQTGAVRVYTNPTTIRANQSATWYVVIPAGPGLPPPTGSFDIRVGNGTTRPIDLSATGDASVQLTAPTSVYGTIDIIYFGDTVYAASLSSFPLTNPPIPGSGGGVAPAPTATTPAPGQPTLTPAPTSQAGPTVTPTADVDHRPTPTSPSTGGAVTATTRGGGSVGPGAGPILLGTLGLVSLAGAAVGSTVLLRRRAGATSTWQPTAWQDAETLKSPKRD